MRRLLSIASLTFLLSALLVTLAVPAFAEEAPATETEHATEGDHATEGEHADEGDHAEDMDDHADEVAHEDDGSDQWLGLKGAAVAGVVFGFLTFFASGTEGLGEEDHH